MATDELEMDDFWTRQPYDDEPGHNKYSSYLGSLYPEERSDDVSGTLRQRRTSVPFTPENASGENVSNAFINPI